MRPKIIAVGVAAVLCIAVFLTGPVSAVFQNGERDSGVRDTADGSRMTDLLDRLEEQGFDVGEIRAAIESGDQETARTLLHQIMVENKDALPAPPQTNRRGMEMPGLLDKLEEQGFDVSAVRTAVENGDNETAHTLLQEFLEEHKDELPTPPADANHRMNESRLLDRLEEQGYDVSTIRAAVESGETEAARTLLQQFMEEHQDEIPAPPEHGDRTGNMTGLLDRLEERGFDVSEIRSAVEAGDPETAHTLLSQFMEEQRDELPEKPQNCGRGPFGNRSLETTE